MASRIYSDIIDIKSEHTRDFYDNRAKSIENMDNPYMAVLLGDQNPQHAIEWNNFEKSFILPQLNIDDSSTVLDIGCGIGRWAESIIPLSKKYVGTDYSSEMVATAKRRCDFPGRDYDFMNMSFQKTVDHDFGYRFNRLVIGGVCMYINDTDLSGCFDKLLALLDEHALLYLTETVAVETRLTLDHIPSEALKADYDVIYRTPAEYREYYKVLEEAGFKVVKQDYLPHLNNEKEFSETDRWYTIFER